MNRPVDEPFASGDPRYEPFRDPYADPQDVSSTQSAPIDLPWWRSEGFSAGRRRRFHDTPPGGYS